MHTNQGRASYKEVGAYLVVLPRPEHLQYTLWIYSSTARKTVHLLHLRPFHRHSRNAADGKHAMLLLTAQPVACGVQCQKNAEQRGRHYLRRQIPRTLPARNPPYRPCLSYVDSFQIPTTHPQAGTFCTDCQDLPFGPSRHTTEKNVPDHRRTFSGEGRRKKWRT